MHTPGDYWFYQPCHLDPSQTVLQILPSIYLAGMSSEDGARVNSRTFCTWEFATLQRRRTQSKCSRLQYHQGFSQTMISCNYVPQPMFDYWSSMTRSTILIIENATDRKSAATTLLMTKSWQPSSIGNSGYTLHIHLTITWNVHQAIADLLSKGMIS